MKKSITLFALLTFSIFHSYGQNTVILFEDFTSANVRTPPSDWVNIQYYTTAVATDSWHFDNPGSRTPGGNFSGQFAIFDSDHYSANGVFESIGLESKPFNTIGHDTVYAVFDYYFVRTTAPICYFEAFNGTQWILVKIYNSASSATRDSINVTNYIKNMCGAKLRFRWESGSGGYFAFDNFTVNSPSPAKANNIDVVQVIKPTPQLCANSEAILKLRYRNAGTAVQSNVPFRIELDDGNTVQVSSTTVTGNSRVCLDTIITFPDKFDISYDSTFSLTAFSQYSNDQTRFNSDTFRFEIFENTLSPEFLDDFDTTFCGLNNNLTDAVSVNSDETAFWFDDSTLNNEIRRGATYPLGVVSKDTTVYVQKATVSKLKYPGTNWSPNVGYNNVNSGVFLYIIAHTDIYIDSLEVVGRSGTSYGYEIYTRKGEYEPYVSGSQGWTKAYSDTISFTTFTTTKIYVGSQFISEGDTLSFYIFNSTANTLSFTGGAPISGENFHLKYRASHVIPTTLFGTTVERRFGYGGSIYYSLVCRSNAAKRSFYPIEYPSGVDINPSTPFNGFSQSNRDVGLVGDTFTYEITPPDGYSNSEFGTKWTITGLTVLTSNGQTIPSGDTIILNFPSSQGNGKLRYIPSAGYTDSTIIFSVTIKNLDIYPYCEKVFTQNVFIAPVPVANFSANTTCLGKSTSFTNMSTISTGFNLFKWYFGNGDSSSAPNPVYTYASAGNYQVRLVATSNLGYSKDTIMQLVILDSPVPDFDVANVCQLDSTQFDNTSTFNSGAFSSFWTFGDGRNSTDESPIHLYATAQQFTVKLVVSANNGCMDSISKFTTVYPRPVAGYTESSSNVCFGINVSFTNTSSISAGNYSSFWTFGDGNTSNIRSPEYKYANTGTYPVKLLTISPMGCADSITKNITVMEAPVANFNVANACEGAASQFNNTTAISAGTYSSFWTLGDGNTSTDQNPSHLYTNPQQYTVKLVVTGNNGCKDSVTKNTAMHPRPVAGYFESTNNICAHTDVSFFNSTTISVGTYTSLWTFGDGNSSAIRNPVHKFNATGAYQVKLLATSTFGCSDSVTKTITIIESPNTDFEVAKACDVLNTEFRSTTIVPDGFTASYVWNLDGQTTSAQMNPIHSFGNTGLKTISLEVTLNNGCKTSMSKLIEFKAGARPQFSNNDFCGNQQASFINNSFTHAAAGDVSYRWDLGDGTTINTSSTLLHTYNNTIGKFYEVKLMTSVLGECHDTLTKMVYSGEVAICDFQIVPTYIPGHRGYQFVPDSVHYKTYNWTFGDQKTSTEMSPTHQYQNDGNYTVKLNASSHDNCNCELTFNHQVTNLNVSELNTYNGLTLYPNPTTGLLNIKILEQSLRLTSVKVMDMTGKIVSTLAENSFKDQSSFEINVSHLASGTYQVLFSSQYGQIAKRFVVVK